jgi:predicted RNA binding protein YcfA (HicA-like mRNA interferase family)
MPRLRRLSGGELIKILEGFGFEVISIKGSHHKLRRTVDGEKQTLHVPVHGNRPIATGTLRTIYRQACSYIPEDELYPHFYAE